jgi:hypothetical protein
MTTHKFENTESNHRSGMEYFSSPSVIRDLAASDLHLCGALRNAIQGKRFGSDEEIITEVEQWL